jgi:hypothetical protein
MNRESGTRDSATGSFVIIDQYDGVLYCYPVDPVNLVKRNFLAILPANFIRKELLPLFRQVKKCTN